MKRFIAVLYICLSLSFAIFSFTDTIQSLKVNTIIDAICTPSLHVSQEGDPFTYISESKSYNFKILISQDENIGSGGVTKHFEYTDCCIATNNRNKKCYPYDDGINRDNLCADFGEGIYSYTRRELKD